MACKALPPNEDIDFSFKKTCSIRNSSGYRLMVRLCSVEYYCRTHGSRVKVEPALQIEDVHKDAFEWIYIDYRAGHGREKFEEVRNEHLQGHAHASGQEDNRMRATSAMPASSTMH